MNEEIKKKSTAVYLVEFIVSFVFVLGFLCVAFYPDIPETSRMLIVSLIITIALIGAWESNKGGK